MNNQTFLDIVFENRNKQYGAYQLRQIANRDLMKSLFFGIGFITLTTGGILFANKPTKNSLKNDKSVTLTVCKLLIQDEDIVIPPVEKKIATEKKTIQAPTEQVEHIIPTPKEKPSVEKTVEPIKDLEKADLGAFNRRGEESTGQIGGGEVSEIGSTVGGQNTKATEGPKETKPVENTNKTITTRLAAVMAIYPGCESESKKGNEALTKCMSDKISKELSYELADFAETAAKNNVNVAAAKMQFIVNKNGEISQVKPLSGSQQDLGKEAKSALERINKQLVRKGKKIKPAQLEDGSEANLIFSIPVKFQIAQ
ncbi:hypothetical protein [Chishuiella sp.]|uniref:hypothetical protein n=1 Tax=Chishuiella sp. TaxID=1969467 RepID=UPI0028AF99D4|nr:hypothetical protein [Chishuiella sp.]